MLVASLYKITMKPTSENIDSTSLLSPLPAGSISIISLLAITAAYYYLATSTIKTPIGPIANQSVTSPGLSGNPPLSALQRHILFWDQDGDNIIWPHDVYNGFRDIGFSIPFSITSLLIPVFFSYPTRLAHSYIPDPFFRIYVSSIQKAKHGSDTGVYDLKGNLRPTMFDEIFEEFDSEDKGSLGAGSLLKMLGRNRVAADPAGWTFAAMEWGTTWLLLQKDGRVQKNDLVACYDGSLFWRLRDEKAQGMESGMGYGLKDFFRDPLYIPRQLQQE